MAKVVCGVIAIAAVAAAAGAQPSGSVQGEVKLAPLSAGFSATADAMPSLPTIEKGDSPMPAMAAAAVTPASPRLTPRGMDVHVYPRPAVSAEGGIIGPYGQGLQAAAPIGTPYLRSPAFAGPPIIYMPQTVTRVLLPGVTPYPANVMYPPQRYVYSSAPFLRTDIYVNLPYGTFYWPQGYAGTTPVEPQVPAYALAPSTAIYSNEASYSTQRYAPGIANAETIDPLAIATPAASTEVVVKESDTISIPPTSPLAPLTLPSATESAPLGTPIESSPGLQPLQPFPSAIPTPAAVLSTPEAPASPMSSPPPGMPPLPGVPGEPAAPSSGMPSLPGAASAPASPSSGMPALPALPGAASAPPAPSAGMPTLPSLPGAAPSAPSSPATEMPTLPPLPGQASPATLPPAETPKAP